MHDAERRGLYAQCVTCAGSHKRCYAYSICVDLFQHVFPKPRSSSPALLFCSLRNIIDAPPCFCSKREQQRQHHPPRCLSTTPPSNLHRQAGWERRHITLQGAAWRRTASHWNELLREPPPSLPLQARDAENVRRKRLQHQSDINSAERTEDHLLQTLSLSWRTLLSQTVHFCPSPGPRDVDRSAKKPTSGERTKGGSFRE